MSERAGIADRAYHKALRPWGDGCRIPSEATLRRLIGAIAGDGQKPFRVEPLALTREQYERKLVNLAIRHQRDRGSDRYRGQLLQRMRELSPLGVEGRRAKVPPDERRRVASLGARALAQKRTPDQRTASARAAANARWLKVSHSVACHP